MGKEHTAATSRAVGLPDVITWKYKYNISAWPPAPSSQDESCVLFCQHQGHRGQCCTTDTRHRALDLPPFLPLDPKRLGDRFDCGQFGGFHPVEGQFKQPRLNPKSTWRSAGSRAARDGGWDSQYMLRFCASRTWLGHPKGCFRLKGPFDMGLVKAGLAGSISA